MLFVNKPSRREQRKRDTRRRLHREALHLVVERGGRDRVTTEEIAAAAEVSARTFFNYFPTKESAILGIREDLADEMVDLIRTTPTASPLGLARAIADWMLDDFRRDPELWQLRRRAVREDAALLQLMSENNIRLEGHMSAAVADRLGSPLDSPEPALLVAAAMTSLRISIKLECGTGGPPAATTLDRCFERLAAGWG